MGAGGKIVKGTRTNSSGLVTLNAVTSPTTSTLADVATCPQTTSKANRAALAKYRPNGWADRAPP